MNSMEQLELIELLFDNVEQDPAMHGSYDLYNADCNHVRLDLLDLHYEDDDMDSLENSLRDHYTAEVLHRILDQWAWVYRRYELLHAVWEQVTRNNLDLVEAQNMMQKKISHDVSWINIMFEFSDWFDRFDSWTTQDRKMLVDQVQSLMQDVRKTKQLHQRLRKRALQEMLEGKTPTVALADVEKLVQQLIQPKLHEPWTFKGIDHCWTVKKGQLWLKEGKSLPDGFRAILNSPDAQSIGYEIPSYNDAKPILRDHGGKPFKSNSYRTAKTRVEKNLCTGKTAPE